MSSDDLNKQIPDELFQRVSAKPERALPDALFGPAPQPATEPMPVISVDADVPGEEGADGDSDSDGSHEATAGRPPPPAATGGGGAADTRIGASVVTVAAESADSGIAEAPKDTDSVVCAEVAASASEPSAAVAESADTSETQRRPVLLVIADSLSYFGPKGGLPADHPRIWPNLVASELDWDVELVARIGWTTRDAYWALIGDPRIWAAVPHAGAVIFAVGGMDTLPSPLPTALRELIRYIRPPTVRRVVRSGYQWLQPRLSKLRWPVALPPKVSVDYLEQSRHALAQLRPDLPVIAVLPSVHDCAAYGRVHSGRDPMVRALTEWSAKTGVPLVDLAAAVRENVFSGDANPDGIHWGWDGHLEVARAMVKTLQEVG